ncbi:MAG: leucine-rich repeat domain-containing protein, partial [Prevotella sp.]|nr:leucine-rich repeat domain-containing protein [Prevotella sp.]
TCTLHVPIGSKEKYKAADVWKDFLNIVEDLPTGIVSIDNSQLAIDNDVWHTLNGVRLNGKPTKAGVYIVNGLKVVIK